MNKTKEEPAKMTMVEIVKVKQENEFNKTFFLKKFVNCLPGAFVMVWIPRIDEKPFSLINFGKKSAINVEVKGEWSKKIFNLKSGEKIGLRGPFGKTFNWKKVKKACIVSGGVGLVPLLPLAIQLKKAGVKTTFIAGAQSKEKILFKKILEKNVSKLFITTDDGSLGQKGMVSEALEKQLETEKFDCVYTCGPEKMMLKVFKLCEKKRILVQASLERFMKCGIGVCGSCVINDKMVCFDGPVFESADLKKMSEFGKTAFLKSGKRCELKTYYRGGKN